MENPEEEVRVINIMPALWIMVLVVFIAMKISNANAYSEYRDSVRLEPHEVGYEYTSFEEDGTIHDCTVVDQGRSECVEMQVGTPIWGDVPEPAVEPAP